ncbi:hypothetical protein BDB00DRAFT_878562 [Zychaea mexicana]|uniref:uncharacterized protein n=1 Tax=Zychaea mexicana TaxID=64656 RepID=UPI0022FECD89|nr:uncharacterized protein BDB00DRAFT_878562 [Zychaea mexicana]KAI9484661.1 hypothetical protein BDB00DRAFT_878562 [Zychaea mexicana]
MADKYKSLKVKELQEILQKNGLPHTGKKEDLIDRLVKHDEKKALELTSLDDLAGLEEFEESTKVDDLDSLPLSTIDQKQDDTIQSVTPAAATSTTTTEAATPAENFTDTTTTSATQETATTSTKQQGEQKKEEPPKEIIKPGSSFKYTPITFGSSSSSSSSSSSLPKTTTQPPTSSPAKQQPVAATNDTAALDLQRKIERAKRFNVDLDEKSKQQLRAQRFGAAAPKQVKNPSSPSPSSSSPKGIDPEVLKKRAERFGIPSKEVEDEKKRKRAERFGVPTKEAEAEKKKRRAERFGTVSLLFSS